MTANLFVFSLFMNRRTQKNLAFWYGEELQLLFHLHLSHPCLAAFLVVAPIDKLHLR